MSHIQLAVLQWVRRCSDGPRRSRCICQREFFLQVFQRLYRHRRIDFIRRQLERLEGCQPLLELCPVPPACGVCRACGPAHRGPCVARAGAGFHAIGNVVEDARQNVGLIGRLYRLLHVVSAVSAEVGAIDLDADTKDPITN